MRGEPLRTRDLTRGCAVACEELCPLRRTRRGFLQATAHWAEKLAGSSPLLEAAASPPEFKTSLPHPQACGGIFRDSGYKGARHREKEAAHGLIRRPRRLRGGVAARRRTPAAGIKRASQVRSHSPRARREAPERLVVAPLARDVRAQPAQAARQRPRDARRPASTLVATDGWLIALKEAWRLGETMSWDGPARLGVFAGVTCLVWLSTSIRMIAQTFQDRASERR